MVTDIKSLTSNEFNDWCPGCLLPDNTIIGNPSAKAIQAFKEGDKVLGSDGYFHKIDKVMTHIHRGRIYKLRTAYFGETTLTDEHPVLTVKKENAVKGILRTEWTETGKLRIGDYVAYPIMKPEKDIESLPLIYEKKDKDTRNKELPKEVKIDGNFLRLAGYYIAEGNVHRREIQLTFGSDEYNLARDTKNLFNKVFGLNATIKDRSKEKGLIEVHVSSSYLSEIFMDWFGDCAADKKIPHEFVLLPKEKQKALLLGLWRGDGFVNKKSLRAGYKTISPVLKEQIKMLLLRQGVVPYVYENKAYGMHKKSYSIEVKNRHYDKLMKVLGFNSKESKTSKNANVLSLMDENYIYLKIRSLDYFNYEGPVYNFEVEDVNSYVSNSATLHNCGDSGIVLAVKNAIVKANLDPHKTVIVSGIGCSSKLPHLVNVNGVHTLHGRPIPFAEGIKLANPELTVLLDSGDGDTYGIGVGHFISAARRNTDIKLFIHDNGVYSLTKGQASPTLPEGRRTKSLPAPNINGALNPLLLAITAGYNFVARAQSFKVNELADLMVKAIQHKGLALVDIMQGCPTYNPEFTAAPWFNAHLKALPAEYDGHVKDPSNKEEVNQKKMNAINMLLSEDADNMHTGVFFENEDPDTFEDRLQKRKMAPPLSQKISDENGNSITDIEPLLKSLEV
jgi:2-oxoglutarate ferredoxin oxidoreductase subunit beta